MRPCGGGSCPRFALAAVSESRGFASKLYWTPQTTTAPPPPPPSKNRPGRTDMEHLSPPGGERPPTNAASSTGPTAPRASDRAQRRKLRAGARAAQDRRVRLAAVALLRGCSSREDRHLVEKAKSELRAKREHHETRESLETAEADNQERRREFWVATDALRPERRPVARGFSTRWGGNGPTSATLVMSVEVDADEVACEHCGVSGEEICHSERLGAWVCPRCYERSTVGPVKRSLRRIWWLLGASV